MEKDLNLPTEYFDNKESNLLDEEVSNNNDLLSLENFTASSTSSIDEEDNNEQVQELPQLNIPEKQLNNSVEIANSLLPTANKSQENENNNIQTRPSLNAEQIIEEISNIDSKISSLEKQIEGLNLEEKNNFNNIIQQENFNDYSSEDGDSVIEVVSNKNTLQKQYLKRDINLLIKQREKLEKEQQKLVDNNTPFVDNNQFVPNFSKETMPVGEEALQKSLEVEKFLGEEGDDPVVVQDKNFGTAVISESQGNLENAIEDHGGIDNALKDSVYNQSNYTQFVPNFSNESVPDNNAAVANNTQKILEVVTGLSSTLKELVGSIKNINSSNNSTSRSTKENNNQTANTQPPAPAPQQTSSQGSREFKPTSNLKGDLPLADDFPAGFDLTQLGGSNLLTRI